MANRYYNQFCFSFRKKLTFLEGSFIVDSTGGADATKTLGAGISSVAYQATGKFRITFMDKYNRFLGATVTADEKALGNSLVFQTNTVLPQTTTPLGYLDVQMRNASGTAVAPTAGTQFFFNVMLDNTTVIPKNEQ